MSETADLMDSQWLPGISNNTVVFGVVCFGVFGLLALVSYVSPSEPERRIKEKKRHARKSKWKTCVYFSFQKKKKIKQNKTQRNFKVAQSICSSSIIAWFWHVFSYTVAKCHQINHKKAISFVHISFFLFLYFFFIFVMCCQKIIK